jgi:hypothetical protein
MKQEDEMIKIALLCADVQDLESWICALGKHGDIEYDQIDILQPDWLIRCLDYDYPFFLARSPGTTNLIKQVFDERIQILSMELGKNIYPTLTEIRLHENKKYLAAWLSAHNIPHPETTVLLSKAQARSFLASARYPLVSKHNIGSSGKGIRIIKSASDARLLIKRTFGKGIRPRIGPNLRTASLLQKLRNIIHKKGLLKKRLSYYKAVYNEPQKFLIFQIYVPHDYEWRVVRIGDSFFAHKKMVSGKMASGSLAKNYDDPPLELLDHIRDLCETNGLTSVSIDLFDTPNGYLINEIQTYFGQSDPYQMKVGGVPGRYRFLDGQWVFEPGDWASNQCYDLRLEHALSLLEGK